MDHIWKYLDSRNRASPIDLVVTLFQRHSRLDATITRVSFKQVACPAAITAKIGCIRADDDGAAVSPVPATKNATNLPSSFVAGVFTSSAPAVTA
jgi:hypothetical protein